MKKTSREGLRTKLELKRTTIHLLTESALRCVAGGANGGPASDKCPTNSWQECGKP